METARRGPLRRVVLVLDGIAIIASMFLAVSVHGALRSHVGALKDPPQFDAYAWLAYATLPVLLALVVVLGLHRCFERRWRQFELLWDLVKLHSLGVVCLALVMFATQSVINRSLVAVFVVCTFALMYFVRATIGAWLKYQYDRGQGRTRVLLVGTPSRDMVEFITRASADSFAPEFIGYLAEPTNEPASQLGPFTDHMPAPLGSVGDLEGVLHEKAVDHVLFFPPLNHPDEAGEALVACETLGISASFAVELADRALARPRVVALYDRPFVSFEVAPKSPAALAVKHGADSVAALLLLLALLPVFVAVSVAILVTMGRPIFFSQQRIGLYGRRFRMHKFRTMVADAEQRKHELAGDNEMGGPVFKMTNDPRITRLGHFLRRASIDELPQLVNVLLGTMSLVGPRPLPLNEQQQIRGWQRRRLSMKPGITGLWQVSGRSDISFEQWMQLDLRYVDTWSLGADVRILLRTVPVVLFGKGAR